MDSPAPHEARAAETIRSARHAVALTGAGASVESGIPDFRSADGLWAVFDPMEYGTLSCFLSDPEKSWRLFRALGRILVGKGPNGAHRALADLERVGRVAGVVTQNVDGLHQAAGSTRVVEVHGSAERLRCPACDRGEPIRESHLEDGPVPRCRGCGRPVKPDVVLFEEAVRDLDAALALVDPCDVLLLVGTSAEVAPVSDIPEGHLLRGGTVVEFNVAETRLTSTIRRRGGISVLGPVGETLPRVAAAVLAGARAP